MSDLHLQHCSNLSDNDAALNDRQITELVNQLDPQWQFDNQKQTISYSYEFKNYYQTMAFANVIAQIAHQQDHHPDLLITYNRCAVTYSTHSVGGLSLNDFICAAKINAALSI
jgi:4a-hydroxytetrahydrobiopterin dehydratase